MMRTAKSLPRTQFSSPFFLAACLAMLAGTPRVGGEVKHITGDWIVHGDTSLRDQQIRLDGSLILPAGAKLTLEDCLLEIVGDYSRHHCVEWKGGILVTGNCTVGGFVNADGTPVHTVFHLYEGTWEAFTCPARKVT